MSTPYTLYKAFEVLRQRQDKQLNAQESFSTEKVDILGIVSNISTSSRASPLTGRSRFRRFHIWLLDDSLDVAPTSGIATTVGFRFVLSESSEITRDFMEKTRVGDIIRFNSVVLKSWGESSYFQFCAQNPEPGVSWLCMGTIDDEGRFFQQCLDYFADKAIPKSMLTSNERIMELANWYEKRRKIVHYPPSTPNALPNRKRQLNDILPSVGFLSTVEVRVMKVRSEPGAETNGYSGSSKTKRNKRLRPSAVYASVTDDSGAVMAFIDLSGRFLSILRLAKQNSYTTRLIMTNVSTQHQNHLNELVDYDEGDVVLTPTKTTSVRLTRIEDNSNRPNTKSSGIRDDIATQIEERTSPDEFTLVSGITDIYIKGLSLRTSRSIFSSSSEFLKVTTADDGTFNSGVVYFESNGQGIQAVPNVLKTLCGSLDAHELSNQELCIHSMKFLHGLLYENILLEFILQENELNNRVIVKATLHHVPG